MALRPAAPAPSATAHLSFGHRVLVGLAVVLGLALLALLAARVWPALASGRWPSRPAAAGPEADGSVHPVRPPVASQPRQALTGSGAPAGRGQADPMAAQAQGRAGASAPAPPGLAAHCAGPELDVLRQTSVPAWLQQQSQQADPLGQAVAWALLSQGVGLTPIRMVCRHDICGPTVKDSQRWTQQRDAQRAQALPQLVRLALGSGEPVVFALAWRACRSAAAPAASGCASLSPDRWVAMAPQAASAWLALAAQAQARGDAAGSEAALHQAIQLPALQLTRHVLLQSAGSRLPGDWPADLRLTMLVDLFSADEVLATEELRPVLGHCQAEALAAEPARLALCRQWADRLAAQAPDMMSAKLGLSLAARSGWSEHQVALARGELEALQAHWAKVQPSADALDGSRGPERACEAAVRAQAHLLQVARQGELAVLRQAMAQQPTPPGPAAPAGPR